MTTTIKRCADKAHLLQPTGDISWIQVDVLRENAVLTQEKTEAALAEMRRDCTAHLASTLLRHLAAGQRIEKIAGVAVPYLATCTCCSQRLRDTPRLTRVPEDCSMYAILEDAEAWARWDAAGRTAAEAVCRALMEQEIGYAYGREGGCVPTSPGWSGILIAWGGGIGPEQDPGKTPQAVTQGPAPRPAICAGIYRERRVSLLLKML